jgi:putative spermidine/putrescine transport system substrate-binding protein
MSGWWQKLAVSAAVVIGGGALAAAAQAQQVTVTSWGGAYQDGQRELYFEPFAKETGIQVIEDSWNGGIGALRAKAQGAPSWDVVQVESDELELGCEEGMLDPIDWEALGGKDRYLPSAVHECGVGTIVWSTALAYDKDRYGEDGPESWADFFDTEKFPGKRALRRGPRQALEFALMADGVPLDQIYDTLKTDEGVDRAFAKLDSIKNDLIWWEAGAQAPQLLASGEVVMTSAYNGRITAAVKNEGKNFAIAWGAGYVYQVDSWVIPANAQHKEEALKLIDYTMNPEKQVEMAARLAYGPTTQAGAEAVPPDLAADLPASPATKETGLFFDIPYWVDNVERLNARFNAWASQ